ncbi:MAG: aldo/keto reductase [Anaerolineales bacterium]|jgi:aryl-alcohol dehydrogenase-like predicted oxidoreductase
MDETAMELGKSGLRVPPLGTGCWAWGDRLFWGYGRNYSREDIRQAFQISLDQGIRFFDTAEVYGFGQSEKYLGSFLQELGEGRPIIVATKFFPYPWRLTSRGVVRALHSSLQRLNLPAVDLYQIHWPTPPWRMELWMEGLATAVQEGLVRAVGVSNFNAELTQRAYESLAKRGILLATNQVQYNLLDRSPERTGLDQACRDLGVTIIAYSPLAQGLLTGKYSLQNPPSGAYRRRQWGQALHRTAPLIATLREIGQAHGGKTPSQVALNWVICKGALPIPGAKNATQARENAGALGWRLTPEELALLDEASSSSLDRGISGSG